LGHLSPGASMASHRWNFYRAGGVDQVILATGADVIHLDELDPKLWVALSMPTRGVELDPRTLDLLDPDKDGHVRQPDIVDAVVWLRGVYRDPEQLMRGGDEVPLSTLNDGPILAGARRVLADLGKKDAVSVSLADVSDLEAVFASTSFNGDGVIPADAAGDDLATRAVIEEIITALGSVPDRSGKPGIDQARIDQFFTDARALLDWAGKAGEPERPLGDATDAAADAVRAVRGKIDDYFVRCRLAGLDARAADALRGSDADLLRLGGVELSPSTPEVAALPIAPIGTGRPLPLDTGLNPAWIDRVKAFGGSAVTPLLGAGRVALNEDDWQALTGKLAAHEAWWAARPAGPVAALGEARLRAILDGGHEGRIRELLGKDLALKPEVDQIHDVEKLVRFQRDFVTLLRNFVNFTEFYARRPAVFQIGRLYLDSRGCNLVMDVADPAKHAVLATLGGAYIVYCDCTRAGEKRSIAAAVTAGDSDNLMVGRNGVLIDRQDNDWDATITKIIENPISIRQAFWSPYKKLARLIEEQVAKRATAAQGAADQKLVGAAAATAHADKTATAAPPTKIDVGTVAAIGVAIGGIGAMVTGVLAVFLGLGMWMPIGLTAIVVLISTPSMLLAYLKLRNRNLGPLLDANGWAINGRARINVPFGKALTDLAALPPGARRRPGDPYAEKRPPWKLYIVLIALLVLAGAWYLGKLDRYLPDKARSDKILHRDVREVPPPPAAPAAPAEAAK
jgi:hypothetical protein